VVRVRMRRGGRVVRRSSCLKERERRQVLNQVALAVTGRSLPVPPTKKSSGRTAALKYHTVRQECPSFNLTDPKSCPPEAEA